MNSQSITVRVSTVRSGNTGGRGGAIFTGLEVDADGARCDAKAHLVVKAPHWMLTGPVEIGQLWRVTGQAQANTIIVNGYRLTESTITPEAMELLRPSGEHIITLLAECDAFAGIGMVKARRLWDRFGEDLYAILDAGDLKRLEEVLSAEAAANLAAAWDRWGDTFTLQWLQSKGFPVVLGRNVLACFGPNAAAKIEEDPYRLISFAADWRTTDTLARRSFSVGEDDPRRLAGAVEEALYAAFDAGHSCLPESELARRLRRLLGRKSRALVSSALSQAEAAGRFVRRGGFLHALGPYVMERSVAEAIAKRSSNPESLLNSDHFDSVLSRYEAVASITLHERQIDALRVANANPIAVITGGAGTGKTTVLRALIRIAEAAGWPVFPMALSGRASKRIGEATGHPAQTIAGFLKRFDSCEAPTQALVIVDEASMVDLPAAYRLFRHLPDAYRFVLVGDPYQLPPVGPGLLLHELTPRGGIPLVELTQIKRYGDRIAGVAAAVRRGEWPELSADPHVPIAFLACALDQIDATVFALYHSDPVGSQVLCATRNAVAGVKTINMLCQHEANSDGEELLLWNIELGQRQGTGFRVGDPVICLKNDWEIDLQNGSLGTILSVEPPVAGAELGGKLGRILWDDGKVRDLTPDLLEHLELAYAITIHKAQGSQFPRIIVPLRPSRLLDRTLLYTAITRAQRQVLLVGDLAAVRAAVEAPPHVAHRQVALGGLFEEILSGMT